MCVALALCVLSFCSSANSFSPGDPGMEKYAREIGKQIMSNWVASEKLPGRPVKVSFDVADDGTIYNPRIDKSCELAQLDGECLSAVCTSSPLEPVPNSLRTGKTIQLEVTFEPGKNNRKFAALAEYRRLHDLQKFQFASFRIPPVVLSRFPGLIKESEIYQLDNLRKSDSGDIVYASHLWSIFFLTHPNPSRDEVFNGPGFI